MGKVLVVQRTVWILRVRSICTIVYENGESTNTVPNKPQNNNNNNIESTRGPRSESRYVLGYVGTV